MKYVWITIFRGFLQQYDKEMQPSVHFASILSAQTSKNLNLFRKSYRNKNFQKFNADYNGRCLETLGPNLQKFRRFQFLKNLIVM